VTAAAIAGFGGLGVYLISADLIAPPAPDPLFSLTALLAALIYAAYLALRRGVFGQGEGRAGQSGAERLRLLTQHAADLITLHDLRGAVVHASPAARPLLGIGSGELLNHGMLERVNVADRPLFLATLARSAETGTTESAA